MDAHHAIESTASIGTADTWANLPAWTILDTAFEHGQHFLDTCAAWRADPQRPHMLHYVGILAPGQAFDAVAAVRADRPALDQVTAQKLNTACAQWHNGFQRITFDQGHISLTLCRGSIHSALGELDCNVDTVRVAAPIDSDVTGSPRPSADIWDKRAVQLLTRRCRRGTLLQVPFSGARLCADLPRAWLDQFVLQGFIWHLPSPTLRAWRADYTPPWTISRSRTHGHHTPMVATRAAVIGAGLAGGSVARTLAVRGWQVSVFDQHPNPAGGASGLPVGLVVPQVSADDNTRSRLSRAGVHTTLQHAHNYLVQGKDWELSGVVEHRASQDSLWHSQAAWIKPACLVRAWLDHPGIVFVGGALVCSLEKTNGVWILRDPHGIELGRAELVVFANAMGCAPLLLSLAQTVDMANGLTEKLQALQATHGTLSSGRHTTDPLRMPTSPVNGDGSFVPHVPEKTGLHWYAGSTFETDSSALDNLNTQHTENLKRLSTLLPDVGAALAPAFRSGDVDHWSNTRCVTHDRLPLVGSIEAHAPFSLWVCAGMGARGLSFSALCAEHLCARLGAEPLPLELRLGRALDVNRFHRHHTAH